MNVPAAGFLHAPAHGVLLTGDALGVDPQQDVDAVPGPLRNLGAGTPPLSHVETAACLRS